MREKWKKEPNEPRVSDGQPIPQRLLILSEPMYKPKLLLKSPSMRAIKNYNNLSIVDNSQNTYDNLTFIPESENDINTYDVAYTSTITSNSSDQKNIFPNDYYDYTTLGSLSVQTGTTSTGSELDSEKNEMGSTVKLVSSKMGMSCQTWFTYLETILCTISFAAGFGNIYRLPQVTLIRGGLPFLIAYIILTILIGLPLLFLELGIGQLAQEGFIKSWRAVPFFKGVGYVKLIAGCLLSIYYPLYIGLSLYYIIWIAKGSLPFQECSVVKMTEHGYSADGIDGQGCLRKTFLESPFEDPYWYGIFAGILFVVWTFITILSIRRTKSFIKALQILLYPTLVCLIGLAVKSGFAEGNHAGLEQLLTDIDWNTLLSANIWYYATIQVFFSTFVGFGSFVTNATIIYNKLNPFWTAFSYILVNLIIGVGTVFICYILSGDYDVLPREGYVAELHLITLIYNIIINNEEDDIKIWAIFAYCLILFAGLISMVNITYTLLKAITVQNKKRLKWWQTSIVLGFLGFIIGCATLLRTDFQLVHLLDHYIVGNLILVSVIIEIFALISFYGTERIKSDFEFMLGHILSKVWLILWWILPILLTGIFTWALLTLPLEGILSQDPEWLYGTGWAVVLASLIVIIFCGFYTVSRQDGYTFVDKMKLAFKPSNNWGPKDPILRHTWLQWNSKAQQGERDFTLKRKGTRDYTRSIKRNAKKSYSPNGGSDVTATPQSVTLNRNETIQQLNDSNEPYYVNNQNGSTLPRTLENDYGVANNYKLPNTTYINLHNHQVGEFKTNLNPLSRAHKYGDTQDGSNSEGYGTFRKGPYIIPETDVQHVCHRKYNQNEDATEL